MEDFSSFTKKELIEKIQSLQEEKQIADSAINSLLDTFFVFNPDSGKAVIWNRSFSQISGYTDDEIAKLKAPDAYYSKEDIKKAQKSVNEVKNKRSGVVELDLICKNGERVPTEYSVSTISDDEGNVRYFISVGRDLRKHQNVEKALKESESFSKAVMDNLPIGIAVNSVDPTVTFNYINDNFAKFYRTTKEALAEPDSFWEAVYEDPEFREEMKNRVLSDVLSGDPSRYFWKDVPITRKGKKTKYISANNIPVPDKKIMISVVWDVTDRKEAENKLQKQNEEYFALSEKYKNQNEVLIEAKKILEENEAYFRKLIEKLPIPMAITHQNGTIEYFNDKLTQVLGYTVQDTPTLDVWWIAAYPDEDYRNLVANSWLTAIEKAYEEKREIEPQVWDVTAKDQSIHTIEFYMVPVGGKSIVISTDVTEEKKKQLELVEAKEKAEQSDRLKSAFLANMSHEIRTPMNGIMGFAELLKISDLSEAKRERYVELIESSSKRMLSTINDLIDISKIEVGQTELYIAETNLNELTTFLYDFFKPEVDRKKIQFYLNNSLPSDQVIIPTDKNKLYAVLSNLVKNAIKFTDSGEIEFGYQLKGSELEFYVRDTGIGIPLDMQGQIFDRFVQANSSYSKGYEGAGLGLPISKAFVELLGGKMWVKSIDGGGSVFFFTIPYHAKANEVTTPDGRNVKDLTLRDILKDLSILVVEDEEISLTYLLEIFGDKCRRISSARNGQLAVSKVIEDQDVDLIFMDIKMPVMDGFAATTEIRKRNKKVIIIAQTAYAFSSDKEKAIQAGCDDYISKPIEREKIFEVITRYFGNNHEKRST